MKYRYNIAKCCIEKACPKCLSIVDAIVINKGTHYNLYCEKCGAYIKKASSNDTRYIYLANVNIEPVTPSKVALHYKDSEKTMIVKHK